MNGEELLEYWNCVNAVMEAEIDGETKRFVCLFVIYQLVNGLI